MPDIQFNCNHCNARLIATPPDGPGDSLPCPRCKRVVTIPFLSDEKKETADPNAGKLQMTGQEEEEAEGLPANFVQCPSCSSPMNTAMTICPNCTYDKTLGRKLGKGAQKTAANKNLSRELRKWGLILALIGGVQYGLLMWDRGGSVPQVWTLWSAVMVGIGILSMIVHKRIMFMIIGFTIMMVGALNIFYSGFVGPMVILGVFQMGYGVQQCLQMRKFPA